LKTVTGVSTASIAKLGKGENITTAVLIKICEGLQCDLTDIMELVDDENAVSPEKGTVEGIE
ncbi:MAG TPA: XRE family transcriptional regulator, partial [Ruminococcaceae bacterium]|nr:XRE family transcriptional regulator [Oscillospiraceae bacterium]